MKFHFNKPGNKELDGPYNLEDAQKLLDEGKYIGTDNVWNAEKKNWQTVAEIPMLANSLPLTKASPSKGNKIEKKSSPKDTQKLTLSTKHSSSPKKSSLGEKILSGKDRIKETGLNTLEKRVVKGVELRKEKISYTFSDFIKWMKSAFQILFTRLPNKRWPNCIYLGLFLFPSVFLSFFSMGLLLAPMAGAYILILLSVVNKKVTRFRFSDLISGDRFFLRFFWLGLILNLVIPFLTLSPLSLLQGMGDAVDLIVILIVACVLGLIIGVQFFAFMLIIERDQKWNEALVHAIGFLKGGIFRVAPLISLFGFLCTALGYALIGIGILLTVPFFFLTMIYLFRHCSCQYFGFPSYEVENPDE